MSKRARKERADVTLKRQAKPDPWPETIRCERSGAVVTRNREWLEKIRLPYETETPTPGEIQAFLSQVYRQREKLGYADVVDRLLEAELVERDHARRGIAVPRLACYRLH